MEVTFGGVAVFQVQCYAEWNEMKSVELVRILGKVCLAWHI
jgi:hypothetical protein